MCIHSITDCATIGDILAKDPNIYCFFGAVQTWWVQKSDSIALLDSY